MRKLGRTASDSLDLLLDTMCSMFGGIILIAILIVLLTQSGGGGKTETQQASEEILQRKIAVASADLAEAKRLKDGLPKPANENATPLAAEVRRLRNAVDAARSSREHTGKAIEAQVAMATQDFSAQSIDLSKQARDEERKAGELNNGIKTQDQNAERLKERLSALDQQIRKAKEERVAKLRFPKEQSTDKATYQVILKYNRVYPLRDANHERNTESLSWTPLAPDANAVEPIERKGLDLQRDPAGIDALLRSLSAREVYFVLYVYTDSFDAFKKFKERVTQSGFDFGWQPEEPDKKLLFGSEGQAPPPPL